MGNIFSKIVSSCWVSSVIFIIRFKAMRIVQYFSSKLVKQPTTLDDYEEFAKTCLMEEIYGFYSSGSIMGHQQTVRENAAAFSRYLIRPRFIRDTTDVDMNTTLLGNKIDFPICVAPTGVHRYLHWEGEIATAKACSNKKSCMILSAFSSTRMEDVSAGGGRGLRWLHMAITMPDDLVKEHVSRAEKAGYKALVITVDQPNVGVHRKYEHIMHISHLVTFANFTIPINSTSVEYLHATCLSCPITWDRIEWVRSLTTLPIVLKGILTAEDALAAVDHNIEGIIVSNHGGRQLDCAPATIDVLKEVIEAVGDRIEVYFDGGIRRGTDVFKALARGAKAVFIGRPPLWGLAYKGSAGVEAVLNVLRDELRMTMQLAGCVSVSDIKKEMVVHKSYYDKVHSVDPSCKPIATNLAV